MADREYLFDVNRYGWLTYAPHDQLPLRLPTLIEDTETPNGDAGSPTYKLYWPGVTHADADPAYDGIPAGIVATWPKRPDGPPMEGRYPIVRLIESGLPDEVPESLAYHLAVNRARYNIDRPVAGLPPQFARLLIERGHFRIDARYRGAALHMQWLAESHRGHPLLVGFDTNVRDRFMEISFEAARLFFYAIGDCRIGRYDRGDADDDDDPRPSHNDLWAELACYLFWVGRSGMGTYNALAGLDTDTLHAETRFHDLSVGDLIERLSGWRAAIKTAQNYAKVP